MTARSGFRFPSERRGATAHLATHQTVPPEYADADYAPPRAGYGGAKYDGAKYDGAGSDRERVVARERQRYGGVKIGSAFFGWLTATGAMGLLFVLAGILVTLIAVLTGAMGDSPAETGFPEWLTGMLGAIIVLVVCLIAYYCGGYVAGRMARFSGAVQGLAVWVWAVVIALVVTVLGFIAGADLTQIPGALSILPFPLTPEALWATVSLIAVGIVSLGGAILGGIAGMRYHRNVDREGFGD